MNNVASNKSVFFLLSVAIFLLAAPVYPAMGQEPTPNLPVDAESVIKADTPVAIAYIIGVVVLKITAFILGYFIVRLGHDTLVKGVTGAFDFGFTGGGVRAKLKAAAPGTFFVLAGAAIIIWGLFVSKPYEIELQVKHSEVKEQNSASHADLDPVLP
jgi:hypothetical protein